MCTTQRNTSFKIRKYVGFLLMELQWNYYPANIYLSKVNYINTRKRCEICSKLTINSPERRYCRLNFTPQLVNLNLLVNWNLIPLWKPIITYSWYTSYISFSNLIYQVYYLIYSAYYLQCQFQLLNNLL